MHRRQCPPCKATGSQTQLGLDFLLRDNLTLSSGELGIKPVTSRWPDYFPTSWAIAALLSIKSQAATADQLQLLVHPPPPPDTPHLHKAAKSIYLQKTPVKHRHLVATTLRASITYYILCGSIYSDLFCSMQRAAALPAGMRVTSQVGVPAYQWYSSPGRLLEVTLFIWVDSPTCDVTTR